MLRKAFILFSILFQQLLSAQQLNYSIINANKGLPSSEVYATLEDRSGYMWFATDHGVARYDGKEFKTYTSADGLPDNTVLRMCEDSHGRIWFYTHSNELCYWQNDSIHQTPASAAIHKTLLLPEVAHIFYVDSMDQIWISPNSRTLVFKPENNYAQHQEYLAPLMASDLSNRLISIDHRKLLLACHVSFTTFGTFFEKKKDFSMSFTYHELSQPGEDQKIVMDARDVPYPFNKVSTAFSPKGVYYVAFDNLLFILQKGKAIQTRKLEYPALSLHIDSRNGLWIGFQRGGIAYYKNSDMDLPPVTISEECSVDDVCVDHEGGVWIATLEKGILYVPSTSIYTYSTISRLKDHITFLGSVKNQMFINTSNNNVYKEENKKLVADPFFNTLGVNSLLYYITNIHDTTYLSYGLQLFRMTDHLIPNIKKNVYYSGFRMGKLIFEMPDHSIWMMSVTGLSKINNQEGIAKLWPSPFRATSAVPYHNDIVVGSKKGLYLFKDNKYLHLGYLDPLLKSQIVDMISDTGGTVWIATMGNGLLKFKDNKVTQFSEKDGLLSNSCQTVIVDHDKYIWVGTNKGISCLTYSPGLKKERIIKNITQDNGLNSNEITKLFVKDNTLWVGTRLGLNTLDIRETIQPIPSSPVYISSITVNNTPVSPARTVFPYQQNNFKITLKGLTFKDNGNHLFRYRLAGQEDTTWQETKSDELLLNNLSPGNYRFEVKVANLDRIWSTQAASYSFTIKKPFWFTWWFITIEVLVLVGIIYLIVLWRTHIIKQKAAEKLRINKLLAEYQMKALTAQMNPHFIFNAINSIQNFIIQNHSTLAYDYLIKFSKLIRLVLNNSNEKEITIQQELDTLAIYIELEQLRFKDAFEYRVQLDPELELDLLLIPSLLLQPYVENAIWHGLMPLETHKGIIALTIQKENGLLKIHITDNGVGRKASDQLKKKIRHGSHRSVGMELTGKRIELFGQEHQFSIQIIDNYDENNNPTGTTVEIILPMVEIY